MNKKLAFLSVFISASLLSNAQKLGGEFGGLGAVDVKSETVMVGGSFSVRVKLTDGPSIGVGISGFHENKSDQTWLPVYADIRIPIVPSIDLTLNPGYTIYSNSFAMSGVTSQTKGNFYAGAGFTGYTPLKGGNSVFIQAKYNYFTFNSTVTTLVPQRGQSTTTIESKSHIVSLGIGLAFGSN